MTACNFRSLLLAAIVLSNCITWTASRHHYTHNVHLHRTRHRRQGAGLYLSASYVIPGGEGSGAWGEWGEVSPCSRTCGGGVASQKRICLQLGPDGQPQCSGGDTKYFSCQTQDCPGGATDFRAEQCSEFDDKEFRGYKYNWVPYTKAPHPCELNCMPHGERFYFRHKSKVIDGTRCSDESFDVCVNGACQPVGCDMMLGSNAREDKCRECRGNGANCHTTDGLFDSQDLMKGYNDILLIPQGSTTIIIEEIAPSNNYLALRAKNGTYYLNGHYHIDFPRSIMIAGALWYYERSQQGYAAPDKLRCLGPTTEPLYLSLLLQDDNVGIQYEYSVPNESAPPTNKRYNWVHEDFTPCSATCGGGFQTRNVTCRSREELEIVDDGLCDEGLKPPTNQSCSPDPCPPQWVEGPWGECSKRCGSGGVQSREVTCQKIIANGYSSIVADKECFDLLGPKPKLFQECNEDAPCPTWFVGRWKPCNKLCDEGTQTRQVVCYQKKNGRIEVLDDKDCTDEKPEEAKPCLLQPCEGVDWIASNWSGCDTCLSKVRTRTVLCVTKDREVLNDTFCEYHRRPVNEEECDKDKLPPCEVQWYATQWSKCSVDCGDGVKTRKVFCGLYDGYNVSVVEDALCADLPKYNDTKPCTVPKDKCPSQWFAGPWSNCTKPCGGGEQYRLVMCFRGNERRKDCDFDQYLDSTQFCNKGPCDEDETLPVDSKSTPIMDEEECDYDTDYPEVGLDAEYTLTTLDRMLSDSPASGYAELEATLSAVSGSESGSGFDDFTPTLEGSGDMDTTTDDAITGTDYDITKNGTKDKDETTKTTITLPTSAFSSLNDTVSNATDDTRSSSSGTSKTDFTESSASKETGSTLTEETNSTSLDESSQTSIGETANTPTSEADEISSTLVNETRSMVTEKTESASTGKTVTEESSVSPTVKTEATTLTSETGSGSNETEETLRSGTGEIATTVSGETGSTNTETTSIIGLTESTVTEETESTVTKEAESTVTEETSSTVTVDTEPTVTDETESTVTEETEPTVTEETESTVTEETEPTVTEETESTVTEETEPTVTEETESTVTEETEPTDTEETESTVTEETEPTVTEETESTFTDTASTDTEETSIASSTEETATTPTAKSESTSSNETGSTASTRSSDGETSKSTITLPTENTGSTTTAISTESSKTTEPSIESSESSIETSTSSGSASTTESGSTISNEDSESTTVEKSASESEFTTISGSTERTEEGSTISSESTSEVSGTSTSGSTEGTESSTASGSASTDETTEPSTTIAESTTEETEQSTEPTTEQSTVSGETDLTTALSIESTEEGSTTEENSTSESSSTQESTQTDESTTSGYSTTEGTESTEESGSTAENQSTTEGPTTEGIPLSTGKTTWGFTSSIRPKKPFCRPRRKPKCDKSKFGCCPDKKTTALGAFDEGCPKPQTCKESTYGCCPDGLSPAEGDNNEGCPIEPCADTLFGCCQSDNKTAAQGNDQDGCPPPPPACQSSEYGCCADNESESNEATGPAKEGCPESETTTTVADTETTSETSESSEPSTSSEVSEGSEGSESTTEVTGSTSLEPCAEFKFGCCFDNETEAPGPDEQGCPCNATQFGCCPDGVSPANGANQEGCPGPCISSQHGCCQDGKTPAHGPDLEGCCLLQAFGCCPDNRKPAEGPHLEGCGCQFARHGCCPDNVTIAQGPDNKGCGCQYTEHGCCPDRHTEASGPNNEGCGCNTFQFGCCADGVTIAKGPEQQGCHCRDSKYGCCGDGETPATGANAAGCDCSSSKHGCCPDGHTEATGPKFLGCTDAPENKQAVCSMSTDPGSCHNFTAMWFYDLTYGGCSRFWYGGCEGNGNRFATKDECEDVCVQPAPKDACKLPSVKGPCDADYVRWHYNSSREQCIPFRYGGCLGNTNNFDTREICQKQCEPDRTAGQCSLPIEQGSCAGNYSRWGFNTETHRCEQFIWGGCEGNSNRFSTEAACQMRCTPPGMLKPQCTEPQEPGNCSEKEALWSFSQSENRCVPFYYTGCGGNSNRFGAREDCEQTCPSAYAPDKCTLPAETGQCSNYREKWFYDTSIKRCRQFYYGGCGGNENNFGTEAECQNSCSELSLTTTTVRPVEPQPQPQPQPEQQPEPEPERPEFCFLPIDSGPCNAMETRFAYDSDLGRCKTFEYGGCGGNQNNFPNEQFCTYYCHPMQDICQLPMLSGPCNESLMRWFYDPTSDSCSLFTYGGCEGNGNRFESLEACENRCRTGPVASTLRTTITTPASTTVEIESRIRENIPAACRVPESLEECSYGGAVWYFDQTRHECVSYNNQEAGAGAACRYSGTFTSQEACERSCGAFRGVDVCKQRVDPGPCQSYVTKVYFDVASGQCHEFAYGGCLGGANRFSTVEECSQVCKAEIDPCTLPPEEGNCFSYIQQWYYDAPRGICNQFVYTGCSGNENRFETQQDCEARCKRPVITTTTVAPEVPPQQTAELECITPSSLAPCGENETVFYYDSERRQCVASGFGGCGHANSYNTEEECERMCGAFRGLDICGANLDPGPCRASIPKYYWDSITGSCQSYAYGGCAGGPNRFSTVDECDRICGAFGPARECLQAVDTGVSCDAAPAPRWHYSAAHVDCVVFAYQGCGGNDNNFHSYDQCADVCKVSTTRGDDSNEVFAPNCEMLREECNAIICQFGVDRVGAVGCERCLCKEDPCTRANCTSSERCVAIAIRDHDMQEPQYSTRCVTDHETNEVLDCEQYVAECSRLQCQYGVQSTRTADGCERCACVQVEIDCKPLQLECARLKCTYGMEKSTGTDGCERCRCSDHPCTNQQCAAGERCVVSTYNNGIDQGPKYSAECRIIVKPGFCPMDETTSNEVKCRHECNDDADCRGIGKCCRRGCSDLCLAPEDSTTANPLTTTYAPDVPAPPQAVARPDVPVAAAEGGTATLRCLFHGNPPPKITWRRGELTIDGSVGRYRLMSDGALEIVSLYRNDTGVYICVADNGLGVARQEIHLVVNDPVRTPVGIAGDENAVVTGELNKPLVIRCLAYGYPPPNVFWYRDSDGAMVPFNDGVYEARDNVLLIRSLAIETLGEYTCQAYNGEGKAASWVVAVQAYRPEGFFVEHEYLVPRHTAATMAKTQPPTTRETTSTTITTTEARITMFTVPVSTHVSTPFTTLGIGADLRLTCDVDGFPDPVVHWTKDGATIQPNDRISITGSTIVSRLLVSRLLVSDSGLYGCHASNAYSSHSDTAQINVQQLMVPAKCTDNPFFANCDLIVRSKFCRHKYYSKFCCKSCVEAGQLDPQEAELQADQPYRRK